MAEHNRKVVAGVPAKGEVGVEVHKVRAVLDKAELFFQRFHDGEEVRGGHGLAAAGVGAVLTVVRVVDGEGGAEDGVVGGEKGAPESFGVVVVQEGAASHFLNIDQLSLNTKRFILLVPNEFLVPDRSGNREEPRFPKRKTSEKKGMEFAPFTHSVILNTIVSISCTEQIHIDMSRIKEFITLLTV